MSAYKRNAANRRLILLLTSIWIVVTYGKETPGVLVKRDTTLDNVKAMYNRFVSDSTGKAKYADAGQNACSMDMPPSVTNTPGIIHVAASKDDFQGSLGCGACLKIIGSGKPAAADLDGSPPVQGSLKGIIVDQDDSLNQGDLALLPPQSGSGLWEINFKAADCPTALGPTGYIQFRFTGSNDMYFKLQAMNAKVPVAGIEAFERVKGKWFCLTRTTDNYFTSEGMGAVSFPLKVRLTSIMNEQLEATVDALKNDVIVNSDIQFSDTEVRGGSPEGIKCYGQGDRPPSTEGDEGFCVSKEDGIYADSEDETAFYVCQGEKATKKLCPTGLKFNPVISSCDVPEDVKFVGTDTDSAGFLDTKENSRWTSLPGNAGLKVLSVGESERPTKEDNKADSNVPQPHKLFSVNIFNGAHTQATNKHPEGTENKFASRERFQGNGKNNVVNITSVENTVPNDNFKKPELATTTTTTTTTDVESKDQEDLRNGTNQKMKDNLSLPIAQKIQSASNSSLNHETDQNEWRHYGESTLSSQDSPSKHPLRPASFDILPKRPETSFTSDHKNRQADIKADRDTNTFQGHLGTSPRKLFAINIYGSHPQVLSMQNEMQTTDENRLDGEHKLELAAQYRDTGSFNNGRKVFVDPLEFHSDQGEAFKTPGQTKPGNDYNAENSTHVDFGSKTVVQDLFSINDSMSSMPLHFKLKINMDNSGKQPVINCTLSECSESNFAIQEDKTNDWKSAINGSASESTGTLQKLFGGHENSGDFHVTFKTGSPEPMTQPQEMKGLHVSPKNLTELIIPPSQTHTVKSPSQPEINSQTLIQPLHNSSKDEREDVFSRHHNVTTILATNKNREEKGIRTQDNKETMKGGDVIQHSERGDESKAANVQTSTIDESAASNINSSTGSRGPLTEKYEADVDIKRPTVNVDEYNDKKLENANQVPSSEKVPEKVNEQKENSPNNKLQTSSPAVGLTKQLENNDIKDQFHEQEQLSRQDFVQIQNRPQLKIILKNPGRILNPLRRRSDAKGHIVKILKSLIDRPLKVGSKNKEVASMLSSLANKPVAGTTRENIPQEDSRAIEDSGNIAQSILEANKEYLDAIAMQGMVFSDGDPETENMTSIEGSINHSHGYQQQEYEVSPWKSLHVGGKGSSNEPHKQNLDTSAHQDDWLNGEHLITRLQDDGGSGESTSGMGSNKDSGSGKPGRDGGSGGLVDVHGDDFNDSVSVTVGQYGASEVNAYKGGILKPKSDPKLRSFCIGKSSGIYKNPFERKSFVICTNGVSEERECPEAMLFNPKEKMCDLPDQKNTVGTQKQEGVH